MAMRDLEKRLVKLEKLLIAREEDDDTNDASVSDHRFDRDFNKQLFMGNGIYSLAGVGKLHTLLSEGIEILNGVQQPPRPGTCHDPSKDEWKQWCIDSNERLHNIAKQIHIALTGKIPVRFKDCLDREDD